MEILSTRIGNIPYNPAELIRFEEGLFGFESLREFVLVSGGDDSYFMYLISKEDPQVIFVVCDPKVFFPEYVLSIPKRDVEAIGSLDGTDMLNLVIATVPESVEDMTINLLGPILIHGGSFRGRQVIDHNPEYTTKHRVFVKQAALQAG